MTKDEAKKALAETWQFSRAGEYIALREVELIEAVRAYEAVSLAVSPSDRKHAQLQASRAS